MKNLILLLLIPILSYSQTYNDLMSIYSEDDFKRVMIENGYQLVGDNITREDISFNYGFGTIIIRGEKKSYKWGTYFKSGNWNLYYHNEYKSEFDKIVLDIKDNCSFVNIENFIYEEHDYVTYKCDKNDFNGRIGFMTYNGDGYITYFPNKE